jgi:aflatoxin B1 aldehyde reductase
MSYYQLSHPLLLPHSPPTECFQAAEIIAKACTEAETSINIVEATFRWLLRHSGLAPTDGLLIGASNLTQLEENLGACSLADGATEIEALPPALLTAFDEAWATARKGKPFEYWRSYSADMPERDSRPPGACYLAHGPK